MRPLEMRIRARTSEPRVPQDDVLTVYAHLHRTPYRSSFTPPHRRRACELSDIESVNSMSQQFNGLR